jgi:hypothetical protein
VYEAVCGSVLGRELSSAEGVGADEGLSTKGSWGEDWRWGKDYIAKGIEGDERYGNNREDRMGWVYDNDVLTVRREP